MTEQNEQLSLRATMCGLKSDSDKEDIQQVAGPIAKSPRIEAVASRPGSLISSPGLAQAEGSTGMSLTAESSTSLVLEQPALSNMLLMAASSSGCLFTVNTGHETVIGAAADDRAERAAVASCDYVWIGERF